MYSLLIRDNCHMGLVKYLVSAYKTEIAQAVLIHVKITCQLSLRELPNVQA